VNSGQITKVYGYSDIRTMLWYGVGGVIVTNEGVSTQVCTRWERYPETQFTAIGPRRFFMGQLPRLCVLRKLPSSSSKGRVFMAHKPVGTEPEHTGEALRTSGVVV